MIWTSTSHLIYIRIEYVSLNKALRAMNGIFKHHSFISALLYVYSIQMCSHGITFICAIMWFSLGWLYNTSSTFIILPSILFSHYNVMKTLLMYNMQTHSACSHHLQTSLTVITNHNLRIKPLHPHDLQSSVSILASG